MTHARVTIVTAEEVLQQETDREADLEREYLHTMLNGLYVQAKALKIQYDGVCQQIAAVRKRLGEEKR